MTLRYRAGGWLGLPKIGRTDHPTRSDVSGASGFAGASADRAGVLKELPNTNIAGSILGGDIKFDAKGDVDGAKFYIFKIDDSGAAKTVQ